MAFKVVSHHRSPYNTACFISNCQQVCQTHQRGSIFKWAVGLMLHWSSATSAQDRDFMLATLFWRVGPLKYRWILWLFHSFNVAAVGKRRISLTWIPLQSDVFKVPLPGGINTRKRPIRKASLLFHARAPGRDPGLLGGGGGHNSFGPGCVGTARPGQETSVQFCRNTQQTPVFQVKYESHQSVSRGAYQPGGSGLPALITSPAQLTGPQLLNT